MNTSLVTDPLLTSLTVKLLYTPNFVKTVGGTTSKDLRDSLCTDLQSRLRNDVRFFLRNKSMSEESWGGDTHIRNKSFQTNLRVEMIVPRRDGRPTD